MNKTLWAIAAMGLLAIVAMGLFAWVLGDSLVKTKKTRFVSIAYDAQEHFQLRRISVHSEKVGRHEELTIRYLTPRYLSFDEGPLHREMQEMARFVYQRIKNKADRDLILKIHLEREEVTGGGCFEKRVQSKLTVDTRDLVDQPDR